MNRRATSFLATLALTLMLADAAAARVVANSESVPASPGSVVAIYARTQTGRLVSRGCGFLVKPGVIVSGRDDRRDDAELFVRVEGHERLLMATPVATPHPTLLDVYKVPMPPAGPRPLRLSTRRASIGDRVVARALGVDGVSEIAGSVLRVMDRSLLEVTFATALTPEQFGGPVLGPDNAVVGTLTQLRIPDGGYLVVPAPSVKARLAGKRDPGMRLGDPVPETAVDSSPKADPPPGPLNAGIDRGSGTASRPPEAPPPPPPGSTAVKKARALNNPRPAYTEQARENGTEGRVLVRVTVGTDGSVTSATVQQGLPDGLNEKAIEAAHRLSFDPARNAAGEPVASTLTVAVDFRISRRAGDVTGFWEAVKLYGQPKVQFYLVGATATERRGLVIIEHGRGDYSCVPVVGSYADGVFEARATVAKDACSYRWKGLLKGEEFDLEEVRTCGAGGEPVKRSIGLAKVE